MIRKSIGRRLYEALEDGQANTEDLKWAEVMPRETLRRCLKEVPIVAAEKLEEEFWRAVLTLDLLAAELLTD